MLSLLALPLSQNIYVGVRDGCNVASATTKVLNFNTYPELMVAMARVLLAVGDGADSR